MIDQLPTSRELYDAEMAQRDTLRGAVGQPITLISIAATLLATMAQKLRPGNIWIFVVFCFFFLFAAYALAKAIYRLAQFYHGHTYKGIPSALQIKRTREQLIAWYAASGQTADAAETDIIAQLDEQYAVAADHNAQINQRKMDLLYLTNRYILFGGVASAAAFLLFIGNQLAVKPDPSVQIIDVAPRIFYEHLKHDRQAETAGSERSATTSTKATTTPIKGSARRPNNPSPDF